MRYDRVPKAHQAKNRFRYTRIIRDYAERIDLAIDVDGQEVKALLPKKYVDIFPADKEVFIPEWLCEKENLL
jgi:hypothetical protein